MPALLTDHEPSGDGSLVEPAAAEVLAMWALARVALEARDRQLGASILAGGESQSYQGSVTASAHNRWGSHDPLDRRKDLERLTGAKSELVNLYDLILEWTQITPSTSARALEYHPRNVPDTMCNCQDPQTWLEVLFDDELEVPWADPPDRCDALLDSIAEFSNPRLDLLRIGRRVVILDLEGVCNSALLLALATAGTTRASGWHEAEAEREVRRSFKHIGGVAPNVPWVKSVTNLDSHTGEIDVMVQAGSVLFDFQAKAPASSKFRARVQVATTGALLQHESLHAALTGEIRLLRGRPGRWRVWKTLDPEDQAQAVEVHVPITVSAEVVREWSVGGEPHGLGRVITSLDHMRMVNRFVPALFRPVYWLDRHLAQKSPCRFVDEIDYLGRWYDQLRGREFETTLAGNLVLASYSELEQHYWLANTFSWGPRDRQFDALLMANLNELKAGLPNNSAPAFTRVLEEVARVESPDRWIPLTMFSMASNHNECEVRLRERRPVRFDSDPGSWGLAYDASDDLLHRSGLDLALVTRGGRWRIWIRDGWLDSFFDYLRSSPAQPRLFD